MRMPIYTQAQHSKPGPSAVLSELRIYSVLPRGLWLCLAVARVGRELGQPGKLRVIDAHLGVQVT